VRVSWAALRRKATVRKMRNGEAAAKANQNRELLLVAVAAAVPVTNVGADLGMEEHQAFGTQ